MRIGLISDTHGVLPDKAVQLLSDCDVVLHAGDIGSQKVLDDLRRLLPNAELFPVRGNCDDLYGVEFEEEVPERDTFLFDGVAFLMAHEPFKAKEMLSDFQFSPLCDEVDDVVFVHGHTHVPEIRSVSENQTIVCPGAVKDPKDEWQRTVGKIEVSGGKIESIQIINLTGSVAWDM